MSNVDAGSACTTVLVGDCNSINTGRDIIDSGSGIAIVPVVCVGSCATGDSCSG